MPNAYASPVQFSLSPKGYSKDRGVLPGLSPGIPMSRHKSKLRHSHFMYVHLDESVHWCRMVNATGQICPVLSVSLFIIFPLPAVFQSIGESTPYSVSTRWNGSNRTKYHPVGSVRSRTRPSTELRILLLTSIQRG